LANGMEMAPRDGALVAGITNFADTPEEVLEGIKMHVETGVDNIKLSMSGEEITEHLRAEDTVFPDEHVHIAVEAAHAAGKRVCGHARSDESVMQCLQYGVDVIYHASFISDATMDALEQQKDRIYVARAYKREREKGRDVVSISFICSHFSRGIFFLFSFAAAVNWLIATLNDAVAFGYTPTKAESVGYRRELEIALSGLNEMRRRGIKVLPGGDYG
jgi:imidazolonepropionase-like amidohydrolase